MLGEAIIWATSRFASGFPATFVMLNPSWVNIEFVDGRRRYALGGQDITDDVLHIRYSSWPGDARGHGPLESAVLNLVGAEALEKYAANLASRGGIPWAVLTHPGNLAPEQASDLQSRFVNARLSAMGAPAVLSGGITLQPLTMNARDMALIELRMMSESRLAVLLGVPPALVGLSTIGDSQTYANITQFFDFHWRAYLRPKAQAITAALSGWLLPRGTDLELNRDEYVRPDLTHRAAAYKTLFDIVDPQTGRRAITIDEIRAGERMAGADATVMADEDTTAVAALTGAHT